MIGLKCLVRHLPENGFRDTAHRTWLNAILLLTGFAILRFCYTVYALHIALLFHHSFVD